MKSLIAMAALMAAAVAAQPAAAQLGGSKSPIDITADEGETHNADCTATWRGAAEALQGTSRLRADVMTATMERQTEKVKTSGSGGGGCGELVTLEAKGSVYFVTPTRRVHGDRGVYDAASTTVTITGDVTAVEGDNVMRGAKMVYNTQTGEGHVEGGAKGLGAKNRPRGVFYPKQSPSKDGQPK
ncbi:LptA/OstA family protein [Phenylobacterium sp.]|uniref:LptA/OstA family protein n=1 Tax=Phenylobacterium sp. TaxID=1871053 RepID=UPI00356AA2C4